MLLTVCSISHLTVVITFNHYVSLMHNYCVCYQSILWLQHFNKPSAFNKLHDWPVTFQSRLQAFWRYPRRDRDRQTDRQTQTSSGDMLTDRHALTDTQSREQVCVQLPTSADTWHYPHLLLWHGCCWQLAEHQSISIAWRTSSQQQTCCSGDVWQLDGTDRRMHAWTTTAQTLLCILCRQCQ